MENKNILHHIDVKLKHSKETKIFTVIYHKRQKIISFNLSFDHLLIGVQITNY